MFDRLLKLIDKESFRRIQNTSILLIGLGGVGGYVFESLVRSGFQKITVIDGDQFDSTNLNRQILATQDTIGEKKVDIAKKRASSINKDTQILSFYQTLNKEDITEEFLSSYDYIIDACDSVPVKEEFIRKCVSLKKKIISCMGTANRLHPELLEIISLKDTKIDPLAKRLRTNLKNCEKCLSVKVVCSKEYPIKKGQLGTFCSVPMAAGAIMASYILNDILS